MGKDYPLESGGYVKFSEGLKRAFRTTAINSGEDMHKALEKGAYVIKGMY